MKVLYVDAFDDLKEDGVTQQKSPESPGITFAKSHYAKRMLNTLCGFGVALVFGSDSFRIDSIGTHLVENAIGIARSTSADPRWARIVTTYAHNELRKELASRLGLTLHVQGRLNDGGCKIDRDAVMQQQHENLVSKPEEWNIPYILSLVRSLCNQDTVAAMEGDALTFAHDLDALAKVDRADCFEPNTTANCGIMARLIEFKTERCSDAP